MGNATTWTGSSDSNWDNPLNWSPNGVPSTANDVTVSTGDPQIASNVGTIESLTLAGAGLDFDAGHLAVTQTVANSGTLTLDRGYGDSGSSLQITGALTNTGTLMLGNTGLSSADQVLAGSLSNNGGTLTILGSDTVTATVNVASAAGTGTAGTLSGTVNLTNDAVLAFASGQISTITGSLAENGAGAVIADAGSTTTNSALVGVTSTTDYVELDNGASISSSGALANSGQIWIDRGYGQGGASWKIAGALTNTNTIQVGDTGLASVDLLSAASLNNNTGTLNIVGSRTTTATVDIASTAGTGTTGTLTGAISLGDDAVLEFANGQISAITGSLVENGAGAVVADAGATTSNSALVGVTSTTDYVELDNGATISSSGALANSGQIWLDRGYGAGGASWKIAGALTNTNGIEVGNTGLASADLLSAASLNNNAGTINILGSGSVTGTVDIASTAGTGTAGTLTGALSLANDAVLEFASGQISTITGSLVENGAGSVVADAGATTTNSALVGVTSTTNYIELDNGATISSSGALANSGQIWIDRGYGAGGASWKIAGALTNTNGIQVGNTGLASADLLSAASLNNNAGTINILGSGSVTGTVNIASTAGTGATGTLSGTLNLTNDALLEFASGQISTITAALTESGAGSVIADAGSTTTNSALVGVTSTTNYIEIDSGASISSSGALANSGQIWLDRGYGAGAASWKIAGALTNTDDIQVGNTGLASADLLSAASLNNNAGTLNILGSGSVTGTVNIASAAGTGTAGTLSGTINLTNDALLEFASGQISTITAALTESGAGSVIADAGSTTTNSALVGVTSTTNYIELDSGASISSSGALANSGQIWLDRGYGAGGASWKIAGALTNTDDIQVGNTGLASADLLSAASLNNNAGTLNILGSGSVTGTVNIASAAGTGTAGTLSGTINLTNDALLEFASGQITAITASLSESGAGSVIADAGSTTTNSALVGVTSTTNYIELDSGATISSAGALANSGQIWLDRGYGAGGASWKIAGALTNTNEIQVGNSGLAAADLLSAASLNNNAGTLNIQGSGSTAATANIASAAGTGTAGVLSGTINIAGDAVLEFATGQISAINASFTESGAGAVIADAGSTTTNSALVGVTSTTNYIELDSGASISSSGALANSGQIWLDRGYGAGGASWKIAGALTNTNLIQIGNSGLSSADGMSVGSLVNSGTVDLNSDTAQATLAATGTIENSGNLNAYFYSSVTAGSFQQDRVGEITLELQGTDAAHHGTITATGSAAIEGGTLYTPTYNFSGAAGDTFNLITFKAGQLSGMFNSLNLFGVNGDGTTVNLGNNTLAGIEYGDSAGVIELKVVTAPTSTADSWNGGSADWGTTADWSNGAPDFYSAVTISTASTAAVTLSTDATIDSLNLGAKDALTTKTGTDLSIGSGISVAGAFTVGGEAFVDGATANSGTISVTGSVLDLRGAVTGAGGLGIGAGATLELGSSDAETVTFNGANATLKLDAPNTFTGALANMAVGDAIDLVGLTVASPLVTGGGTALTFTDSNSIAYSYSLTGFPGGSGFKAQSDGSGGTLLIVTPPATTVTLNPIDGTNTINHAQAAAGVALSGSVSGLAVGAMFSVQVVDGAFSKTYTATVGASGTTWTATIPSADALTLPDGSASVTAVVSASAQASQSVVVHETAPVVTISAVDGNSVINHAQAAAGVTISGSSTGLASGATFSVSLTDGSFSKNYTAMVGANGAWSATVPAADAVTLTNGVGAASLAAKATDAYGNVSATANQTVTVEETLPSVAISAVDGNNVINHAQAAAGVTVSGTSTGLASGATFLVSVVDGTFSKSYTANVGAGGAWSATIGSADATTLGNGSATLTAQATDAYGNVSATATDAVTVAGNVPTVAINKIDGNNIINSVEAHASGGVALSGTVTGLASGATFSVSVKDGSLSKSYMATVGAGGAWTATIPSTDAVTLANGVGAATVSAQVTDAYGNVSTTATQSVTVEETLPTLTISQVEGNNVINHAQAAAGVTASGTSTGLASAATFTITVTDGSFSKNYTATVGTGGAWTAAIPSADATALGNGSATITAQATDAYGNVSAIATDTVTIAGNAPTVAINKIDGGNIINYAEAHASGGVVLSGTVAGLATGATFSVGVTDGSFSRSYLATVAAGGTWSATIPSSDAITLANGVGAATVSAQVTDAYGNVSTTATQSVTIEETPPSVTINKVDGNNVINYVEGHASGGVALSGTVAGLATGATFNVSVTDGSFSKTYVAMVAAGGTWTASIPSADATTLGNGVGAATISAQVTDAYGNVSTTATQSVTVEETLPIVTISKIDGNDIINNSEAHAAGGVTLSGTVTGLAFGATFNVTVVDGSSSKSYLATVGTAGAWTAAIPSADAVVLANGVGAATVSAQVTDAYGNLSTTATQAVTVEETLPTVTINAVNGNNVINSAQAAGGVTVSGASTGLASGATFSISVTDGAFSKSYSATVGAGGAWSATIPAADATKLGNGSATITAQATDAYGNVSASATDTVTIAGNAPTVAISMIDGNNIINYAEARASSGVALSGTVSGLAVGATFLVSVKDGTFSKTYTAAVAAGGTWTAAIASADAVTLVNGVGAATVSAQVTDAYGNVSTIATESVTVEETLPSVAINKIDGGNVINYAEAHASGGVALSGTVTGLATGATFLVSVKDGAFSKTYTATVAAGGTWTATIPSSDAITFVNGVGVATVSAQVTDAYGNVSTIATQSVTIEETLPTVAINKVDGNDIINYVEGHASDGVALSGTVTGLATGASFNVSVTDGSFSKTYVATVAAGGTWTATVPSADAATLVNGIGAATVSAQVTDAYGNVSVAATQSVTVEETAPSVTISPVDGNNVINFSQAEAGVSVSGSSTGLAPGATFSILVTDGSFSKTYAATVGSGGAWTATIPAADAVTLANGSATITAQATDAYGNASASATDTVTVAGNAPTVSINKIDGNDVINYAQAHASAGIALSGTVTGLATGATFAVSVTDGSFAKTYTATVAAGGVWTANMPDSDAVSLNNGVGAATVSAKVTDAYGNASTTATQLVTVEETLPTVTINAVDGNGIINGAQAAAGVQISGASTGLASGATFNVSVVDGSFSKSYIATVGTGGAWTATIPSADALSLVNGVGAATVGAQATDAYGNVSAKTTQSVTVEETVPTVTIDKIDGNNVINAAEANASGGVALSGDVSGLASGSTFGVLVKDGSLSKIYTATVGAGGAWTATIPSSDAITLPNGVGVATVSAQVTDAYGNASATASQSVTVEETLPTVTINKIDGNDIINYAEAHASGGVALSGAVTGLAVGATFSVNVADGSLSKTYAATVGAGGVWTATLPSADALILGGGVGAATISAQVADAYGNVSTTATQIVTVEETLPTVTISAVDGDNTINHAQAALGVTVSGTSTGLASGATFAIKVVDGSFSKSYTATVGVGGAWTATIPSADATTLGDGSATITAQATDAYGNVSAAATDAVTVQEALPTVTVTPVDGNNIINYAEANNSAGVTLSGTVSGLSVGATFSVMVVEGAFSKSYTATVGANGNWTANLPMSDATALSDGTVVVTAKVAAGSKASENVTVAETLPQLVQIVDSPASGDLDAGQLVLIKLFTSANVTVTGAPTLLLNDGGVATYDAARSAAGKLVFDYTTQAGQNTTKLLADQVVLNGGAILDSYGNALQLSLGGLAQAGPKIDTVAPVLVGLTENPSSGDLGIGKTVKFYVAVDEAVTVNGTPTLALNDGGVAIFNKSASTSTMLVFTYTVAAGQNVAALAATALNLSGGGISDLAGNAANVSLANINQSGPQIDALAPSVNAILETPATGDFDAGKTVTFLLTMSEAVTVGGAPILKLNDGGTAIYSAGQSTATQLAFVYTVQAGQNTAALQATSISLTGGSIVDIAGNAAKLSLTGLTQLGPQIDTTAPKITAIVETPPAGDLGLGAVMTLALTVNEPVTVAGIPTLTLNDGGKASYDAAKSTSTLLVFDYTVGAGQNIGALKATTVNLAGGTIDDLAGNAANLSISGLAQSGPKVDTTPPTFTALTETPATGDFDAGNTVAIALTMSEAVSVAGAPTLVLNDGGVATYDAAKSTTTKLVFDYTVAAGQNTPALAVASVNLSGGAIDDLAGNAANLAISALTQNGPQIDTTRPMIVSMAGNPASGDLTTGQIDTITVAFSEKVAVHGTALLELDDGGDATYTSGSGTKALTFQYRVLSGETTADLTVTEMELSSGLAITDLAGNPLIPPSSTQDLGVAVNHLINLTGAEAYDILGPSSKEVIFASSATGTLTLSDSQQFTGEISGFSAKTTLDFTDIDIGSQTSLSYSGTSAGGTLSINDGTHYASISLLGNYLQSTFLDSTDGFGGTKITETTTVAASSLATHPHA